MRLIYVASVFTGPTPWHIAQHVRLAEEWGYLVMTAGGWPVIPQANTQHFFGSCSEAAAYAGTMEMMRRCDGVFVGDTRSVDGKPSKGVALEIEEARQLEIPIFAKPRTAHGDPDLAQKHLETWIAGLAARR